MNKLVLTGNLTRSPELRSTPNGIPVCTFTIAVNGRKSDDPTAYFRITVWRQLAEICNRYLTKGKKVFVSGPVSVSTYTAKDGTTRASLEVTAEDVEFLSPATVGGEQPNADAQAGFVKVEDNETLPF